MSHITHLRVRGSCPGTKALTLTVPQRFPNSARGDSASGADAMAMIGPHSGARQPNPHQRASLSHGGAIAQGIDFCQAPAPIAQEA